MIDEDSTSYLEYLSIFQFISSNEKFFLDLNDGTELIGEISSRDHCQDSKSSENARKCFTEEG